MPFLQGAGLVDLRCAVHGDALHAELGIRALALDLVILAGRQGERLAEERLRIAVGSPQRAAFRPWPMRPSGRRRGCATCCNLPNAGPEGHAMIGPVILDHRARTQGRPGRRSPPGTAIRSTQTKSLWPFTCKQCSARQGLWYVRLRPKLDLSGRASPAVHSSRSCGRLLDIDHDGA